MLKRKSRFPGVAFDVVSKHRVMLDQLRKPSSATRDIEIVVSEGAH